MDIAGGQRGWASRRACKCDVIADRSRALVTCRADWTNGALVGAASRRRFDLSSVIVFCAGALLASEVVTEAHASDTPWQLPLKAPAVRAPLRMAPAQLYDWSGWYIGGHMGYGFGRWDTALFDPGLALPGWVGSNGTYGAAFGGAQVGYNYLLPSHVLLGIEADASKFLVRISRAP